MSFEKKHHVMIEIQVKTKKHKIRRLHLAINSLGKSHPCPPPKKPIGKNGTPTSEITTKHQSNECAIHPAQLHMIKRASLWNQMLIPQVQHRILNQNLHI